MQGDSTSLHRLSIESFEEVPMCAMDTRERAFIRQSGLPEIILSVKYPVCVRTESGKFIDSNSVFLHLIKCQNSDSDIWFSGIDIDRFYFRLPRLMLFRPRME